MKMLRFTKQQAAGFYAVHREKPFFSSLTTSMSSGPCIALVLEKEQAVEAWRTLMGATNPDQAAPGTIRKEFAVDLERNSVHGSDARETAEIEIKYCFGKLEFTS
jgi:nucleoside-diphosphate kinase